MNVLDMLNPATNAVPRVTDDYMDGIVTQLEAWANDPNQYPDENRNAAMYRELKLWRDLQLAQERGEPIGDLELDLKELGLSTLSPTFHRLPLTSLDISKNKLPRLPNEICQLHKLRTLKAENNGLGTLPMNIGELGELRNVYLSGNRLVDLPPSIGQWSKVEVFEVAHNKLGSLPTTLGGMRQLRKFLLNDNALPELPEEIGHLLALRELDASRNDIERLPESFRLLVNLVDLSINHNKLSTLPDLQEMTELAILYLVGNSFSEIPSQIRGIPARTEVFLDDNDIEHLPYDFADWPSTLGIVLNASKVQNQVKEIIDLHDWKGPKLFGDTESISHSSGNSTDLDSDEAMDLDIEEELSYEDIRRRLDKWCDKAVPGENRKEAAKRELEHWRTVLSYRDRGIPAPLLKLDLSGLGLRELSPTCCRLPLRSFHLNNNKLTRLPSQIGKLTELVSLRVNNNHLTSITSQIGKLKKLQIFEFERNELPTLPKEIGALEALTNLKAGRNRLSSLPEEIGQLDNLLEMDIGRNRLRTLPDLSGMASLRRLYAQENRLEGGPPNLANMRSLLRLHLEGNRLTSFPEGFEGLNNLEVLGLKHNHIDHIPTNLSSLWSLKDLYLSGNRISEIPEEIADLQKLEVLVLDKNRITSVPARMGDMEELVKCDLEHNRIERIDEMGTEDSQIFINLEEFNLGYNRITSLPAFFGECETLERLFLNGNRLESAPDDLSDWNNQLDISVTPHSLGEEIKQRFESIDSDEDGPGFSFVPIVPLTEEQDIEYARDLHVAVKAWLSSSPEDIDAVKGFEELWNDAENAVQDAQERNDIDNARQAVENWKSFSRYLDRLPETADHGELDTKIEMRRDVSQMLRDMSKDPILQERMVGAVKESLGRCQDRIQERHDLVIASYKNYVGIRDKWEKERRLRRALVMCRMEEVSKDALKSAARMPNESVEVMLAWRIHFRDVLGSEGAERMAHGRIVKMIEGELETTRRRIGEMEQGGGSSVSGYISQHELWRDFVDDEFKKQFGEIDKGFEPLSEAAGWSGTDKQWFFDRLIASGNEPRYPEGSQIPQGTPAKVIPFFRNIRNEVELGRAGSEMNEAKTAMEDLLRHELTKPFFANEQLSRIKQELTKLSQARKNDETVAARAEMTRNQAEGLAGQMKSAGVSPAAAWDAAAEASKKMEYSLARAETAAQRIASLLTQLKEAEHHAALLGCPSENPIQVVGQIRDRAKVAEERSSEAGERALRAKQRADEPGLSQEEAKRRADEALRRAEDLHRRIEEVIVRHQEFGRPFKDADSARKQAAELIHSAEQRIERLSQRRDFDIPFVARSESRGRQSAPATQAPSAEDLHFDLGKIKYELEDMDRDLRKTSEDLTRIRADYSEPLPVIHWQEIHPRTPEPQITLLPPPSSGQNPFSSPLQGSDPEIMPPKPSYVLSPEEIERSNQRKEWLKKVGHEVVLSILENKMMEELKQECNLQGPLELKDSSDKRLNFASGTYRRKIQLGDTAMHYFFNAEKASLIRATGPELGNFESRLVPGKKYDAKITRDGGRGHTRTGSKMDAGESESPKRKGARF